MKNPEDTVITVMVETSFKYLISSAIYVGMLQLLDLLATFDLHRIQFVELITSKKLKVMTY